MARPAKRSPFDAGLGELAVSEWTLDNGLAILILPRRRAPVVLCDLYYPVGSFNEPPGLTGMAHFVEHMLFKGTERFPKGQIDRLVSSAAGQSNAETSEDGTHYWFTFPSDRWELALAIEADRMRGARFDPREFEIERQVIVEERARDLNSPQARLEQTHLAVSFLRHPYRNPILGWPDDIARIKVDDLRRFYQTHYRPDGAVLVVVGDVEPEVAFDQVASHFAAVPAGELPVPRAAVVEPRQSGRRDFELSEPDSAARAIFGWRTVSRDHRDAPALDVLADLLSCGRRSRLWHALVETDQTTTWIEAVHAAAQRGGQFLIQLEAATGANRASIERRIAEEIRRLADRGPSPDELARSRRRLQAVWRWEHDDLPSLASGLGTCALWNDWHAWQADHRAALAVDSAAIRRVIELYLREGGLTAGWSLPRTGRPRRTAARARAHPLPPNLIAPHRRALPGASATPVSSDPHAAALPTAVDAFALVLVANSSGVSRLTDYRPCRTVLENGLRLVYEQRPGTGVIALELWADAGLLREAKPGLAYLTGRLLEEGTTTRSALVLAQQIEDIGGSLEVGSSGCSLRICREDLPLALELLSDVAIRPAFPAESLSWAAERVAAELRGDLEDPAFCTELCFRRLIYGTHPLARDPRGSARDVRRLTRNDAVAHHRRHFTPENSVVVAVGDFDPRRLVRRFQACFGGWTPLKRKLPPFPAVVDRARPRVRRIHHPGDQAHIMLGHRGIARNHPDFDALTVLDHIFGSGPGFSDRLGRIVRDELGLVYAIGGGMTESADVVPGLFRVYAGTMPGEVRRVVATITEQVRAMHSGAFSDDEVDRARSYLAGAWAFDFQSVEQRAERLLELERWGLDLDGPRCWPQRIAAISPRQVRAAARRHLQPDSLSRVELGPLPRRARGKKG
jgi:zinc protease